MSFNYGNMMIEQELSKLKEQGLYRHLRRISSAQGREIVLDDRRVLNFCSNDYLGLANDERIKHAAKAAIDQYGFGSGASRLVSGNMSWHEKLEENIAQLKQCDASLVFSTGYMANTGIISSIIGRDDIVFSDRLNHASIIDGIVLSRATLKRYPHKDMQALEDLLKETPAHQKKFIVTDSVFSMDGDVAPLTDIVRLAQQYDALVMVDEAHGFGVLGATGAGLVEVLQLSGHVDIQMGTLSKAAGCFGAYVAGSKLLREYFINHARSFIYTTAMPAAVAAAASCAVDIIRTDAHRRQELQHKSDYLRGKFKALGLNTLESTTPIIPVIIGDSSKAVNISAQLLSKNIFVQAIRPPTVPDGSARLRFTVMATHTSEDLDAVIHALTTILS